MALRYCFEREYVKSTLAKCKSGDLAVVDTEGCETAVKAAVKRGVLVYGYLNAGALESGRNGYSALKSLRLARYDGWDGEYWVDVTAQAWKSFLLAQAQKIKACGAIGLYLDNADIYWMCAEGFKEERAKMYRKAPSAQAVYNALSDIIIKLKDMGLIVMPNGGDVFLRKFIAEHPGVIQTINQEGVFFEDFKKNSTSETAYRKSWCKWAQKRITGKVRVIEYCKDPKEKAKIKAYCLAHGWHVYFSKHKELRGD